MLGIVDFKRSGVLLHTSTTPITSAERNHLPARLMLGRADLKVSRARGRFGGRPKKLNEQQTQMVKKMWKDHSITIDEICRTLDISRATLFHYLKE